MLAPKSYAFKVPHTAENDYFLQPQAHEAVIALYKGRHTQHRFTVRTSCQTPVPGGLHN